MSNFLHHAIIIPLSRAAYKYAFLKDNYLWRRIKPYYINLCYLPHLAKSGANPNSIAFFNANAERVNAVANMLADEKSKKIYLDIIKFRQTRKRKDFPLHAFRNNGPLYFSDVLKIEEGEILIDGGAYTGDTITLIIRHCKRYRQIVAFEPDPVNFLKLKEKYGNDPQIMLINAGLYDKDGTVQFDGGNGVASRIIDNAGDGAGGEGRGVTVKTIDNLGMEKISYIKMDIEGAELNALMGAQKTII